MSLNRAEPSDPLPEEPSSADARAAAAQAPRELNSLNPRLGIGLKVASALVFTGMVALVKLLGGRYPVGEVIFARSFFGIIPVLLMVAWQGKLAEAFVTRRPWGHVSRAIVGGSAMAMWFAALARLPLPDATAISFSAPLITVALAALILREKVRAYRWSAVIVGFLGILIILSPHLGGVALSEEASAGAMLAFAAAVFMALAMITVRRLTSTERTSTIVVWFAVVTSLFALMSALRLGDAGCGRCAYPGLDRVAGRGGPDPADPELPLRRCLDHRAVRIHDDDLDGDRRLGGVRRGAEHRGADRRGDRHQRRRLRHLPRTPARPGPLEGASHGDAVEGVSRVPVAALEPRHPRQAVG